jgi:hypothetical protein
MRHLFTLVLIASAAMAAAAPAATPQVPGVITETPPEWAHSWLGLRISIPNVMNMFQMPVERVYTEFMTIKYDGDTTIVCVREWPKAQSFRFEWTGRRFIVLYRDTSTYTINWIDRLPPPFPDYEGLTLAFERAVNIFPNLPPGWIPGRPTKARNTAFQATGIQLKEVSEASANPADPNRALDQPPSPPNLCGPATEAIPKPPDQDRP